MDWYCVFDVGRSIGYLNEMHHLLRMKLLLPAFLISLESGNLTDLAVVESLGSARKVTNIARSYLSHRDGLHDKNIMLERCVYISGLLLCACSAVFHLDFSLDIQVHLEAMKIIYMNSDVQNFEYCVVSPALAIQILQTKFL